jgi:hypothetical protein
MHQSSPMRGATKCSHCPPVLGNGPSPVRALFKITLFLLLAIWLPATNHCDFEALDVAGIGDGEHCPLACGEHGTLDACSVIEGDSFSRTADLRLVLTAPQTSQSLGFDVFSLFVSVPKLEPSTPTRAAEFPELLAKLRTWSFDRRASAPARAPNRLV